MTLNPRELEALEVVETLNLELEDAELHLTFLSTGDSSSINLSDIVVWWSDDDPCSNEPIGPHVRREIADLITDLLSLLPAAGLAKRLPADGEDARQRFTPTGAHLHLVFDNEPMAKYFKLWLCEQGEQSYRQWMEAREEEQDEDSPPITATTFDYHQSPNLVVGRSE